MKKLTLLVAAIMTMSTFAVAASGTYDADGPNSYKAGGLSSQYQSSSYYAGIAYGAVNTEAGASDSFEAVDIAIDHDTLMLQAGYKINAYMAVEGRYWTAVRDADASASYTDFGNSSNNISESGSLNDDSDAWGIYMKPMYPVTSELTAYGLLGYGNVELEIEGISTDDDGFQWGLGALYNVNDNVAVFIDYVSMYDETDNYYGVSADTTVDSWNFGLTYRF